MRSAGILLPVFSLDNEYGIGTFGKSAYRFIDFLKESGVRYWQVLPLGPTGYGNSPYQCYSSFAGNPLFIDPELLAEDGLLSREDLEAAKKPNTGRVAYDGLLQERTELLAKTFAAGRVRFEKELRTFEHENAWLEDYALFMALHKALGDMAYWDWPEEIRVRKPEALDHWRRTLHDEIALIKYIQFLFFRQWKALKTYANENKVGIIGDIPIYCAPDASDVWSQPQFFRLKADGRQNGSAGVPPDAFNDDGQYWGNPLYDWDRIRNDGYGLWIRRIDAVGKMFDMVRIDHFRAFDTFYVIPAGAKTAKEGTWEHGPGMGLISVLNNWFPHLSFIAEDLGDLVPSVYELRDASGWPGMNVLGFAFYAKGDSNFLPHCHKQNSVTYIGTHDNDTLKTTVDNMSDADRAFAMEYLNVSDPKKLSSAIMRAGIASVSDLFVMQMQDLMALGREARINEPGTVGNLNWSWRMHQEQLAKISPARIKKLLTLYGRT